MDDQVIGQLVEVYFQQKALKMYAEEANLSLKTYLQPNEEIVRAWDHLMRAQDAEQNGREGAEYIKDNLQQCMGHLHRAYFDTADWCAAVIRDRIREIMEGHSNNSIQAVCPEYYKTIKPDLHKISQEIANIRERKGHSGFSMIKQVREYSTVMNRAQAHLEAIMPQEPALIEYDRRGRRSKWLWWVAFALAGALSSIVGSYLIKLFSSGSSAVK